MEEIKIETGIPLPTPREGSPRQKTLAAMRRMEVGESFVSSSKANTLWAYIALASHEQGKKFASRKQPDGTFRVWRIS